MTIEKSREVIDGICRARPRGECTLIEAVDLISGEIAYCRAHGVTKFLFNATGLTGVPVPSLVDRFLMIEEWAQKAQGMVFGVLVTHAEYIHPEKFGVKVGRDFGLIVDVFTSESEAFQWLASVSTSDIPDVKEPGRSDGY